jgi:NarL family two-component system response regulator LiaR
MEARPIRILVVDDHDTLRLSLVLLLETYDKFEVVGEACNGEQAITLSEALHPDVVLMDLLMPKVDGVVATEVIHRRAPDIAILVLTSTIQHSLILDALRAGATGYVLKNTGGEELVNVIHNILPDNGYAYAG